MLILNNLEISGNANFFFFFLGGGGGGGGGGNSWDIFCLSFHECRNNGYQLSEYGPI